MRKTYSLVDFFSFASLVLSKFVYLKIWFAMLNLNIILSFNVLAKSSKIWTSKLQKDYHFIIQTKNLKQRWNMRFNVYNGLYEKTNCQFILLNSILVNLLFW